MADVTVPWVRPDQLGDYALNRLGDGGQGVVYGVPRPPDRLHGSFLAYKEFKTPVDADVLHDMCCFLGLLSARDRAFLQARLTWPAVMVYQGRRPAGPPPSANPGTDVVGFLMPRVPGEFELHSPQLGRPRPQALEYLLNDDAYAARIGLYVDDGRRLRLLADLARTLDRLHAQRVTVGDLSPKNVMFTLSGQGRCLLIDCDSMRYRGRDVLPQVETPGWEVPEREKATVASDAYKLGLIALRLFNRSQDDTDAGPLRGVSTELANLAIRSLSPEPRRRPAPAEWLPALELADARARTRPATAGPRPTSPGSTVPTPSPVQPGPVPAQAGASRAGGTVAALVALLVAVVLGYAVLHDRGASDDDTAGSSSTVASAGPYAAGETSGDLPTDPGGDTGTDAGGDTGSEEAAPEVAEAPGATVDYSLVADDPEAEEVAAMFARFYGAVNNGDYDTALDLYDPATSAVDVDSAESRAEWVEVMSTTQDSDVVLGALRSSGEHTLATLSFRSRQSPGYGPAGRPGDTCDDWTVTYQLTRTDGYRIYKAPKEGVSYTPC
ncbi:hypothetical protein GCM10010129_44780 [Streptomyces fumigatiscleroticus]|nr:hypothetical protein GCM10010129_44780 [Streptomyces fumigatiscleroticus]